MRINNDRANLLREDFPIFKKNVIYLDSAATSQKPIQVIEVMNNYYKNFNANIHRGVYKLSEDSTILYNKSRKIVAGFIGAEENEIIFTRGATESLNLLAYTLKPLIEKGRNEIVLSALEHHSNLIPWQQFAKRHKMKLRIIGLKKDLTLDFKEAKKLIGGNTAIVSFTHISNAFGIVNPIEKLVKLARKNGAISIIDAAQSVSRVKINVKKLDVDFLVFSGHKMMGPMGIGVLYGKKKLLDELEPFNFGGGMVESVSYNEATWAEVPEKFEAGTPNIVGAIGLAKAIKYIEKIGIENIGKWEDNLTNYATRKLKSIEGLEIYGKNTSGIISFNLDKIHPHDVASLVDLEGIAIRVGNHCAMPLMKSIGISGTCRISFYLYNTFEDIEKLIFSLNKVKEKFA